ncbi:MAG: hypothetical protein RLY87_1692 [Chloroflexota bacterium]|jgi:uncharacterized membrane protein YkvA (DUF1232 family)
MQPPKSIPLPILLVSILFSVIYIINPTAGFLEFIPDNLPLIGNLDEAGATALLIWAINEWRKQRDYGYIPPRDVTPK